PTFPSLGHASDDSTSARREDAIRGGLDELSLTQRASVVVATHAESDEEALEQVLGSGAGYVSVVASRRRAAVILERLKKRGVPREPHAPPKGPAGLDMRTMHG